MKRFLLKFAAFSVICLVGCIGGDLLLSWGYQRSPQPQYASWYDVMHGQVQSEVVVNGNSRTWALISPAILDSVLNISSYNLGMDGSAFNRQVVKYHLFRRYNKKPVLIIQNVDHMTMEFSDGYQRSQFYPYFWNPVFRKAVFSIESVPFADKYLPLFRYRGKPLPKFSRNARPVLYKGYAGADRTWDGTALRNLTGFTFTIDPRTEALFDDFLQEVTAEGIKIVFVYAPFYEEGLEKIVNLEEMRSFYAAYARQYGIPVLDYTTLDICKDTSYFYNASHLNRKGAEAYSKALAEDLESMGILQEAENTASAL